jgi:hypothetical protein
MLAAASPYLDNDGELSMASLIETYRGLIREY